MKHVQYENKNYVLIFGNEKDAKIDYFKCLIYEVKDMQLTFIKKAVLTQA